MFNLFQYLGGAFLGWGLGANNTANAFGTAVSSGMVKYRVAIILMAVFVVIGALTQGQAGIETLSKLRSQKEISVEQIAKEGEAVIMHKKKMIQIAMIITFAAALTTIMMTILKLPISTSQAVAGAIIGVGLMQQNVNFSGLQKVVICWVGTPIGGMVLTFVFYWIFKKLLRKWNPSVFIYDPVISILLILCGCYGAYALGANNVANVSAVFVGEGMLTVQQAAVFGGITIAVGVLTYSKPVMMTVGKGIIKLDSFSAFICVLSHAVTVHMFAIVGVPVSTSQAIVGAVLGIGFIKGAHTVNYKKLLHVSFGWFATPLVALIFAAIGYFIANLRYIP